MGKRSSTAAGAAAKKAKTVDTDASVVGNWVQTKIGERELSNAEKIGILKNDPAETLAVGPEIIPQPPQASGQSFLLSSSEGFRFPLTL
jgi:hypothetical protein